MADKIIMPQLGESIAEGTIVKWLKQPGESVDKDENVVLISTDKVEAEIPSPSAGVLLEILVEPGETVDIGTVLGSVGEAGEKPAGGAAAKPAPKEEAKAEPAPEPESPARAPAPVSIPPAAPPIQNPAQSPNQIISKSRFYSPLVKKIAAEHNIIEAELDTVIGSGHKGRLTKKDLLAYIPNRNPSQNFGQAQFSPQGIPQAAQPKVPDHGITWPTGQSEVAKPVSTMRKVIMENMIASRQKSAHVTTFFEIDYTAIDKVRNKDKDAFKLEEGVSLTYTTFLTSAITQVLRRHPYINAEVRDGQIVFKKDVHLGIAVAIEQPEPGAYGARNS